ncbi:hypothetical protein J7L00_05580 [Candidatus Bathyarchaeota archaeon]|nr:hypothetical protein [Candidatus Bathyarchaeota archaeon]
MEPINMNILPFIKINPVSPQLLIIRIEIKRLSYTIMDTQLTQKHNRVLHNLFFRSPDARPVEEDH